MGPDDDIPFTLALPEHTWHLLTPAERRVTALTYEVTLRCADAFGLALTLDDLALVAELHARFTETTA